MSAPGTLNRQQIFVVSLFAILDLLITAPMAFPPTARWFLSVLEKTELALGDATSFPAFEPYHIFFLNVAGMLGVVWALGRLLKPSAVLACTDAAARMIVAGLIVYYVVLMPVPRILAAFVFTEILGSCLQFYVLMKKGDISNQ